MKNMLLALMMLAAPIVSVAEDYPSQFRTYGVGVPNFVMPSNTGGNLGQIFNSGTTWGLGFGPSGSGIGTQVLTWSTSKAVYMTGTLDVVGGISAASVPSGLIVTAKIGSDAITTAKIADSSVVTAKIASDAVIASKIGDGAVVTAKVGSDAITSAKVGDGQIVTAKVAASAVTTAKMYLDLPSLYLVCITTAKRPGVCTSADAATGACNACN